MRSPDHDHPPGDEHQDREDRRAGDDEGDHHYDGHHHDGHHDSHRRDGTHGSPAGVLGRLRHLFPAHSHDAGDRMDTTLATSREGLRALWLSLLILGATAAAQALVVLWSASVALLGDTLHNVADALTAVPLGLAFLAGRRTPTRRYTYGFGRAEDLAGIAVVAFIAASAIVAGWSAIDRLLHPAPVRYLGAVAGAAIVGFLGNEAVAQLRTRVGRRIGSAALVADGLHARADGLTSLGVLLSAAGVALGWTWADPIVGLAITVAILIVLRDAARQIYRRLMDAVDPETLDAVETALRATEGVRAIGEVKLRWIGHSLRAECEIVVDRRLSVVEAHRIAVNAEHQLIHAVPRLAAALVHADPDPEEGTDHHANLSHHR